MKVIIGLCVTLAREGRIEQKGKKTMVMEVNITEHSQREAKKGLGM